MSEGLIVDEVGTDIPNEAVKTQIGHQAAEVILARGTIEARILAQQRLLEGLGGLPAEACQQQQLEIEAELASLALQQSLPDHTVVAWYRGQREESASDEGLDNHPVEAWLKLTPSVLDSLSALRELDEDEAFEQLGVINDACETIFNQINDVTGIIEAARPQVTKPAAPEVIVEAVLEPVASEPAEPVRAVPAPVEIHPPLETTRLNLPDDFIEQLQTLLAEKPVTHVAEIVRSLFGVKHLERHQFNSLRTVLAAATYEGLIQKLEHGYFAAARAEVTAPEPTKHTHQRRADASLDTKLREANLGTASWHKPRQRVTGRSKTWKR